MGTRSWDRGGLRGCSPAPQSEPEIDPLDIEDLADILTAGRGQIGVGHAFSFTARRDVPPTVTAVNFDALGRYTIEEVPRLMLLSAQSQHLQPHDRGTRQAQRAVGVHYGPAGQAQHRGSRPPQGLTTTIHHRGRPLAALGPRT